ncbi:MAG: T9SS type A sorting domain-containing protein [Phycisphaerae bacterium]|nr:T9SS type A sorting domain-containing protein [Saprospiraceae bacterium]
MKQNNQTKIAASILTKIGGIKISVLLCFHTSMVVNALATNYPALPQVYIETSYASPVGGQLISVNTSAAFQTALNTSKLGDIIELQAGTTFTGPFTLPNKTSGTGWIYIRSSAYASLPAPCERVSPADAANMPKLVVSAGNGGAINTASNAHHYRFVGIEFKPVAGNYIYNIIYIGNGETLASKQPNNLVFDRCYIHGDPVAGSRRGVLMNGAYISVIDSYVSDCKEDGADSQALAAYSTTGPLKIVNNFLEGAGENVIFGGSDPSIPNAVASDIEIRNNLFFKPLSWMNELWDIKNLLEFKNAQRILVEGNRFENCWPNAQSGYALVITPRNQNNTAPWSVVQDLTIRLNTFVNVAQGIIMSGFDAPNISQRTSRVLIQNNVLNVTNLGMGGDGRLFVVLNGPTDVIFDHNTGFCTNAYMVSDGSPKTDFFVFKNNLVTKANYGFIGSGTPTANATLAAYFNPNWEVTHNAVIGGSATGYPVGSYFPANIAAVGFVNYAAGDYRLANASPYKNLGTDGKDLGADIDSNALGSVYDCSPATPVVEADKDRFQLVLFPVPVKAQLHVQMGVTPGTAMRICIYDLFGQEIYARSSTGNDEALDVSMFPEGIYWLVVQSQTSVATRKFVVQR